MEHSKLEADILMPSGRHETWLQLGPKIVDEEDLEAWKVELQEELDAEAIAAFRGTVLAVRERT
tara:strand:- start:293 stop:484 length:192 start_codon:yes stop_codon:yes gene_type:complete